jgi:glucokinase
VPAVVCDAGGTHLRCAIARDDGRIDDAKHIPIQNFLACPQELVWGHVLDLVTSYTERASRDVQLDKVIFAVPGPVRENVLLHAPTLSGPNDSVIPDVAAVLSERTALPVVLLNDVSAAAWYAATLSDVERFLLVTVSSGIGSKLFDRRYPRRVFDTNAHDGELGHIIVDRSEDAPPCDCGGKGHLGAISSGRGIERFVCKSAQQDGKPFAAMLKNEDHVVPLLRRGDPWMRAVVEEATRPLALALSTLFVAAALERIVVMGGFAQAVGDVYHSILGAQIAASLDDLRAFDPLRDLQLLDPGVEPGVLGAAAYYRSMDRARL